MDLIEEIKQRATSLKGTGSDAGVSAVIRHIETAETYLLRGRSGNNDDFFNDVIYRTNQAFEGALKEAYGLLTQQDGRKKSPYEIEQKLIGDKVLAPRVHELFTNYRTNWRNPSTHDHTLFFGEQEALLAIVSVAAFIRILLDQMVETVAAGAERRDLQQRYEEVERAFAAYNKLSLPDQVAAVLRFFSSDTPAEQLRSWSEPEFVGTLLGFLQTADPDIQVLREPRLAESRLRPDLLVRKGEESVVVELKRSAGPSRATKEAGVGQLLEYLLAANATNGILFYAPDVEGDPMVLEKMRLEVQGRNLTIQLITPSDHH